MGRRRRDNGGCFGCGCGCFGSFFLLALLVVGLCGGLYYFISANMPTELDPNFQPSQSLATNLESKLSAASRNASRTGTFNLSITEAEAASWLNLNSPSENPFENIQVQFRNGEAIIYGESRVWDTFDVGSRFGVTLGVTANGQLEATVTTADIGGFEMPQNVKDSISEEMKRIIDEELKEISGSYRLTGVNISDGRLGISGNVR